MMFYLLTQQEEEQLHNKLFGKFFAREQQDDQHEGESV